MLSVRRTETAAGRVERTQPVQECAGDGVRILYSFSPPERGVLFRGHDVVCPRTPYSDVREGDSVPVVYLTSNPAINAIAGGRRTNAPPWPLLFLFPLFGLMIFAAPILAAVLAAPARPQGLPNGDGSSRNDRLRRQAAGLLVARLASAHSSRRVRPSTPPDGTGARSSRRVHERLASRAPSAGGRGHSSLPPRQSERRPPRELSAMRWCTSRPRAAQAPQTGVMRASTAAAEPPTLCEPSVFDPADRFFCAWPGEDECST